MLFVLANLGLALLCGGTGAALLQGPGSSALGWSSLVLAALAAIAAGSYAATGPWSPHGDWGFLVLVLQLIWLLGISTQVLLRKPSIVPGSGSVS